MMHLTKHFEHLKIQLETIKSATNNFADDNCIGRGGFGKVYKGELVLYKGHTIVALKRLDTRFGQGHPEFWKEIIMLSQYKHENIVSLLGFCDEGNEKILVYEYASRRSLDLYLNNDDLTWMDRLNICIGVARGLAYLHNPGETQQRALHRDIKSSNILLDKNWNAKISDLGLSKLGPANQQYTFLVSNIVGTIGYCDPLYVETGLLTKESDVYSFGVVLFEVLCGRLCTSNKKDVHQSLTGLVRRHYKENNINDLIFGNLRDTINHKSLEAFITIAYQCLKRNLEERPLMVDVVRTLESALEYQVSSVVLMENTNPTSTTYIKHSHLLSPFGEACSRIDLTAIHEMLEKVGYKDDKVDELSFDMWTTQMSEDLMDRKRGDKAFQTKDFNVAIEFYTSFIKKVTKASPTVYARRCFCYLMNNIADAALRDAMHAEVLLPQWSTALFLQAAALFSLGMENDANEMLKDGSMLENQIKEN
ncbi:hypothetical protein Lser_V15G22281 [Lactuca serriola]